MLIERNAAAKISLCNADVAEVTGLWDDALPSEKNRAYWASTKERYEEQLAHRDAWMGRVNLRELEAMMRTGWQDGANRVRKLVEKFDGQLPQPQSIKRRARWTEQGDEIDMPRVYNGQLDTAWRRTVKEIVQAPQIISLVLPWCHSAAVEHSDMFWGAAAVLACTDILEDAGYQVELIACNPVIAAENWLACTNVTVKGAGEPLRMDSLAAVTAHAASYRYYGIPSVAHVPTAIGYGWAHSMLSIPEAVRKLVRAGMMPEPFYVSDRAYSQDAAVRYVRAVVQKLEASNGQD